MPTTVQTQHCSPSNSQASQMVASQHSDQSKKLLAWMPAHACRVNLPSASKSHCGLVCTTSSLSLPPLFPPWFHPNYMCQLGTPSPSSAFFCLRMFVLLSYSQVSSEIYFLTFCNCVLKYNLFLDHLTLKKHSPFYLLAHLFFSTTCVILSHIFVHWCPSNSTSMLISWERHWQMKLTFWEKLIYGPKV